MGKHIMGKQNNRLCAECLHQPLSHDDTPVSHVFCHSYSSPVLKLTNCVAISSSDFHQLHPCFCPLTNWK